MKQRLICLVAGILVLSSCEYVAPQGGRHVGYQPPRPAYKQQQKVPRHHGLMLYGGEGHRVFLGVLSENRYAADSIANPYGEYGSPYAQTSIWNDYGTYGSPYSDYSPWNEYASNPPVVVDADGNFYGYLTVNPYHGDRASDEIVGAVRALQPR